MIFQAALHHFKKSLKMNNTFGILQKAPRTLRKVLPNEENVKDSLRNVWNTPKKTCKTKKTPRIIQGVLWIICKQLQDEDNVQDSPRNV